MLKSFAALLLVCLMINFAGAHVAFAANTNEKALAKSEAKIKKHAVKIKKGVEKLGVGKDSKVKIKLLDKTKISGYISQIGEDSFTVMDASGKSTVIDYRNTKQIKGNNLHAGVWVAIGVGIAIVAILIILNVALDD